MLTVLPLQKNTPFPLRKHPNLGGARREEMEPLHLKGGALSWEWTRRERFFTKQRRFLNADRKEGFRPLSQPWH